MELRSERAVLRPMTEADRPALEAIVADRLSAGRHPAAL
jgi:hypothetical protein